MGQGAKSLANNEMAEIKALLAGNLLKKFKKINEADENGRIENHGIDEEAIGIMDQNDRNSRLHSIAMGQAKQRLTLRKVTRNLSDKRLDSMGRLERKNTIKKNVEEIVGFVPPEVKFRQQQNRELQDYVLKRQLIEEGQENWVTNQCVEKPFTICCCAYMFLVTATAVAFFMDYFTFNSPNDREFAIWGDQRIIDWDMVESAKLQLLKYEEGIDIPIRSEKMTKLNSVILYKSADTNVSLIEKRTLEKIQTLEEDILSM